MSVGDLEQDHTLAAEQQVLGAILYNADSLEQVADILRPDYFSVAVHGEIYEAMLDSVAQGRTPTPITLAKTFTTHPGLAEVGGNKYLVGLMGGVISPGLAGDYALAVKEAWVTRNLLAISDDIAAGCNGALGSTKQIIEDIEDRLYSLAGTTGRRQTGFTAAEASNKLLADLQRMSAEPDTIRGITTGLKDLDSRTGGIRPGHLWIMGGRPGMGKSAVAVNMAARAAWHGHGVLFVSLEMPVEEVMGRLYSIAAQSPSTPVPFEDIGKGRLTPVQLERLTKAKDTVDSLPLYIDDEGIRTAASIRLLVRRAKRLFERDGITLGLVVIDYLQLMRGSQGGNRDRNRTQEVTEITVGLKALAKEYSVGVLALSQLSRQVESRDDKRPQLSDLRESGSIEQDADVVIFPYRDHYYIEKEKAPSDPVKAQEHQDRLDRSKNTIDMIVAKQRHGQCGTVQCDYDAPHGKITNRVRI